MKSCAFRACPCRGCAQPHSTRRSPLRFLVGLATNWKTKTGEALLTPLMARPSRAALSQAALSPRGVRVPRVLLLFLATPRGGATEGLGLLPTPRRRQERRSQKRRSPVSSGGSRPGRRRPPGARTQGLRPPGPPGPRASGALSPGLRRLQLLRWRVLPLGPCSAPWRHRARRRRKMRRRAPLLHLTRWALTPWRSASRSWRGVWSCSGRRSGWSSKRPPPRASHPRRSKSRPTWWTWCTSRPGAWWSKLASGAWPRARRPAASPKGPSGQQDVLRGSGPPSRPGVWASASSPRPESRARALFFRPPWQLPGTGAGRPGYLPTTKGALE
mmetsp:Transcript_46847/g.106008  ORF Transcript_46847/g.106008 Transcript_46847/m.106008 type:complete len:329 (+) Transcript_46847:404-1390(+)